MKAAILTFHNTPNYGATLQCYALSQRLRQEGADVEVINYMPLHNMRQYAKSLFLGRRRGIENVARVQQFHEFCRSRLTFSGPPIFGRAGLKRLNARYDVAFVGSDEVWKVDHMRHFDPSFYFDFLDPDRTRLCSYAASASSVTNLDNFEDAVRPLLQRFDAIAVRDPHTGTAVEALTGTRPVEVLDPTFIHDFAGIDLPPVREKPYVAVYSWLNDADFARVRETAIAAGLDVVCVGCRHRLADENRLGLGPEQWLRYIKHASLVVSDFYHGGIFAMLFERPFYLYVDVKKRMKLEHLVHVAGLDGHLHENLDALPALGLAGCAVDYPAVWKRIAPARERSIDFLRQQLQALT